MQTTTATVTKKFVDVGGDLGVLEEGTEVDVVFAQPRFRYLQIGDRRSDMITDTLVAAWCVFRSAEDLGYRSGVVSR